MERLIIKRALLSVTDKTGLEDLATFLYKNGVELISTGGTKKFLESKKLPVTAVSKLTGFPEILDGRVKTLHPKIYAGILADKNKIDHISTLSELNIKPFDLVCVNLYDFAHAIEENLPILEAVEQIDIGGPCLLRAAAKNFHSVLVLPAPELYVKAVDELKANNMIVSLELRQFMAARAFANTVTYDSLIASFLR